MKSVRFSARRTALAGMVLFRFRASFSGTVSDTPTSCGLRARPGGGGRRAAGRLPVPSHVARIVLGRRSGPGCWGRASAIHLPSGRLVALGPRAWPASREYGSACTASAPAARLTRSPMTDRPAGRAAVARPCSGDGRRAGCSAGAGWG